MSKGALEVRLHNRRVIGKVHTEDGMFGYHFLLKRLSPDGKVMRTHIKLSDEALEAMVAIAQTLKRKEVRDGKGR